MTKTQDILDTINRAIVDEADIQRVTDVLRSGFLSKPDGGPYVAAFQEAMAKAHNQKHAFAVNSGTSALHCAIMAMELNKGDEVIIPALANIADYSVIIQEGGTPIFADIDPKNFNIDPASIEAKITEKTRAIIVVHMYGQPAKMHEIMAIAKKRKLAVIEDCAQAAGARYNGEYVGSFGDISCVSLYQTKHIICGEGGIVMTSNDQYAAVITSVANNGIIKDRLDDYDYDRIGCNYQLSEIHAALALGQLQKLDKKNIERRENVAFITSLLADLPLQFQHSPDNTEHSYFYLTALLPESFVGKRDEFCTAVQQLDSPIKKLYPLALTELTLMKGKLEPVCPIAQHITKRVFNIHVNPGMKRAHMEHITACIRDAYNSLA